MSKKHSVFCFLKKVLMVYDGVLWDECMTALSVVHNLEIMEATIINDIAIFLIFKQIFNCSGHVD